MNKISKLYLLFTASIMLSSCATVISGSSQNINIRVVDVITKLPIDGAVCIVNDSYGDHVTNGAISSVRVKKGGSVSVVCTKENYRQLNVLVGDSFNAVSLVNVVFWPGFLIDAATGAYKSYPSHYLVSMEELKK